MRRLVRQSTIWWPRISGLAVALLAVGSLDASAQDPVAAYQRALTEVCRRQVTPELVQLYQEAVKAMEASRNGYGQGSNFYGVRDPYLAYNDCLQAPSRPR
jgi:hypothetical protein